MTVLLGRLYRSGILSVAMLLTMVSFGAVQGHASKADLIPITQEKSPDPLIVINDGMAEVVDIGENVADVLVADPMVIDVISLQKNKIYIVGVDPGTTNVMVLNDQGDVIKRMNVHVTIDVEALQRRINEFFPGEDIKVSAVRAQYVLTGTVSTPAIAQQVQNLVTHLVAEVEEEDRTTDEAVVNLLVVRGTSQVTLRVKIMEVDRSLLREYGTDTLIDDIGIDFGDNVENSPFQVSTLGDTFFAGVIESGITQTPFAQFGLREAFGAFGPIDWSLNVLEEKGLAKILAEPNLTAISGEQASFLAGGEFPVPAGRDNQGNIEVIFRQFGVSLNFAPIVLSADRISMQFDTEVSSLARDNQVTLSDVEVPGLDIRRASTTVELASGATLMIAGLLQSEQVDTLSGIPGMTRTPIIGQLMSSESFRRNETELVVLVTPYLVTPMADKKQAKEIPPSPREKNYLSHAFAKNIRRAYGDLQISELFEGDEEYGYILD